VSSGYIPAKEEPEPDEILGALHAREDLKRCLKDIERIEVQTD
jgi:hypothetical protein